MPSPTVYTEARLAIFMIVELSDVATALQWDAQTAQIEESVNDALSSYGVSDIADATDVPKLRAIARVMAWRAAVKALSSRFDFSSGQHSFKRSQMVTAARQALDDAESIASDYGLSAGQIRISQIEYTENPYAAPVIVS